MLETAGLDATLRWLAEEHQQRTGVVTEVVGHLAGVPGDVAIVCFRVVQEALTNILRHARAHHVRIELKQSDGALEVAVRDDGVGFEAEVVLTQAAQQGHLGLVGMKERVQILGGTLDVHSEPGHGTGVRVSLPATEPVANRAESLD
jgi:two-component system sensor histidine kinase UhpB